MHTFYSSFTIGYILIFLLEVVTTTIVRLVVFLSLEREVFDFFQEGTSTTPFFILPWVLRTFHYKPKRITIFLSDFVSSCVASPIIEEVVKWFMVFVCFDLPMQLTQDNIYDSLKTGILC